MTGGVVLILFVSSYQVLLMFILFLENVINYEELKNIFQFLIFFSFIVVSF